MSPRDDILGAVKSQAPTFDDCLECTHYRPGNTKPICRRCPNGEQFELKVEELSQPSEPDLWKMFKRMSDYNDFD